MWPVSVPGQGPAISCLLHKRSRKNRLLLHPCRNQNPWGCTESSVEARWGIPQSIACERRDNPVFLEHVVNSMQEIKEINPRPSRSYIEGRLAMTTECDLLVQWLSTCES